MGLWPLPWRLGWLWIEKPWAEYSRPGSVTPGPIGRSVVSFSGEPLCVPIDVPVYTSSLGLGACIWTRIPDRNKSSL